MSDADAGRRHSPPPTVGDLRSGAADVLVHPVWVLDPERAVNVYANPAALRFWGAASAEELAGPGPAGLSDTSQARLDAICARVARGEAVTDRWTFHPQGGPVTMDVVCSAVGLDDGRPGLLVEGVPAAAGGVDRRAAEALRYTPVIAQLYDDHGEVLFRNPAAVAAYPSSGHRFVSAFVDEAEGRAIWQRLIAGETVVAFVRVRAGGRVRWHDLDARRTVDPVTGRPCVLVNERDVTELKTAMAALREREHQLSEAQEIGRVGDWHFDPPTRTMRLSPRVAAFFDLEPGAVSLDDLLARLHEEDRAELGRLIYDVATDGTTRETICRVVEDGSVFRHVWQRCGVHRDGDGAPAGIVGVVRDVTDEVRARERVEYLAWHDSLTGLIARPRFRELLSQAVRRSAGAGGCVMIVDIDHFREINDIRGHAAGDEMLIEVGRRLKASARATDVVGRLAGDEFGLVLPGLQDIGVLDQRAKSIREIVSAPILVDGTLMSLGASVGIAVWPDAGTDADELMRSAALALASVQAERTGGSAFFTRQMRATVDERRRIVAALPRAIDRHELDVHYQPIVRLSPRRLAGFEALVRWEHSDLGRVPPEDIVSIAEEAGMMWRLGGHVLETALGQMRRWLDAGFEPGRMAVNLGAGQLRERGLAGFVRETLDRAGLRPDQLELEVTETVTLRRRSGMIAETLGELHRLGVAIVLDDFGTGHASLTHLRRLPIDRLKIDRSFVANLGTDGADTAIVRMLIGLARELRIAVVAEGVETEEQAAHLQGMGCEFAQGFFFGRPMSAEEATEWLDRAPLAAR